MLRKNYFALFISLFLVLFPIISFATCTETGLIATSQFSVCDTVITEQCIVPIKDLMWSTNTIISQSTALQHKDSTYTYSSYNEPGEDELLTLVDAAGNFGNGLSWHLEMSNLAQDECTLIISGNGNMPTIWSTSSLPDWYDYRNYITAVIIEDGINNISSYAFYNFSNLAEAKLGNTVATIDEYSFGFCSNLADIYIPQSVQSISNKAFYMGTSATTIHLNYNSYAYTYFKNTGRKIVFNTSGSSGSISWSLSDDGVLTFSGEGVLTSELAGQAEKEKVTAVVMGVRTFF